MRKDRIISVFFLFVIFTISLFSQEASNAVDYKVQIVEKEAMFFIGLTAKTSMAVEDSAGIIGQLWGQAMQKGIMMTISNKVSGSMFGLYYDYEIGEEQSFTVMVACQVANLDSVPEGMTGYSVPASRYAVFTTPRGNMIQVVKNGWAYIWADWMSENPDVRSYVCDYEEYDDTAMDMDAAIVKLFVALKKE